MRILRKNYRGLCSLALTAGIPQIVVPFGHDQFDNADRIEAFGVGLRIPKISNVPRMSKLSKQMLADPSCKEKACKLAQKAVVDKALANVCAQIERTFSPILF